MSQRGPRTEAARTTRKAEAGRRRARAETASRTVEGSSAPPDARISVTKKGFPAVARWRAIGSIAVPAASAPTAVTDNGARTTETVEAVGMSPSATDNG